MLQAPPTQEAWRYVCRCCCWLCGCCKVMTFGCCCPVGPYNWMNKSITAAASASRSHNSYSSGSSIRPGCCCCCCHWLPCGLASYCCSCCRRSFCLSCPCCRQVHCIALATGAHDAAPASQQCATPAAALQCVRRFQTPAAQLQVDVIWAVDELAGSAFINSFGLLLHSCLQLLTADAEPQQELLHALLWRRQVSKHWVIRQEALKQHCSWKLLDSSDSSSPLCGSSRLPSGFFSCCWGSSTCCCSSEVSMLSMCCPWGGWMCVCSILLGAFCSCRTRAFQWPPPLLVLHLTSCCCCH